MVETPLHPLSSEVLRKGQGGDQFREENEKSLQEKCVGSLSLNKLKQFLGSIMCYQTIENIKVKWLLVQPWGKSEVGALPRVLKPAQRTPLWKYLRPADAELQPQELTIVGKANKQKCGLYEDMQDK